MQEQGIAPVVDILVNAPAFWILVLVSTTRWVLGPAMAKMVEASLEPRFKKIEEETNKIPGIDFRVVTTERLCEDLKCVPGDVREIDAKLEMLLGRRQRDDSSMGYDRRSTT